MSPAIEKTAPLQPLSTDAEAAALQPETVIAPPSELPLFNFRECLRSRHLLAGLIRRNVAEQLGQFLLGGAWSCVRPLVYVAVFVAFRNLSSANAHVTIPYALYVYSGLILWFCFLDGLMGAIGSIRANSGLMKKVYLPPLLLPIVPPVSSLIVHAATLVPLAVMLSVYGIAPSWRLLLLPLVLLQFLLFTIGIGFLLAPFSVEKRDYERLVSTCAYVGLFVSPVVYSPSMIPEAARLIYSLNPMVGTLMAFRSSLCGPVPFPAAEWTYSCVLTCLLFIGGLYSARRAESMLLDRL